MKAPKFQTVSTSQSKPKKIKPAKPISKAMEEGREPLRSFSDLVQFVEKKKPKHEPAPPPELIQDNDLAANSKEPNATTETIEAPTSDHSADEGA